MKKMLFWILLVVSVLLLGFAAYVGKYGITSLPAGFPMPRKQEVNREMLQQTVQQITRSYQERNAALLRDFEAKLASAGDAGFNQAFANIPDTAAQFTGFKCSAKLCYKLAKDKIKGTDDTSQAIAEVIGPRIIKPCEEANAEIRNTLIAFILKLQESDNLYRTELLQTIQDFPLINGESLARTDFFGKELPQLRKNIYDSAIETTASVLGAAFDVAATISVRAVIKRALGAIAARMVAGTSASAIMAAADGPLPIGDIAGATVTLGFLAWSAYDIYKVSKIIPQNMQQAMRRAVSDYQRKLHRETLDCARKTVEKCNTLSNEINTKLNQEVQQ